MISVDEFGEAVGQGLDLFLSIPTWVFLSVAISGVALLALMWWA